MWRGAYYSYEFLRIFMKVSMDLTYDSLLWNLFSIVLLSNYGQSNKES